MENENQWIFFYCDVNICIKWFLCDSILCFLKNIENNITNEDLT